MKWRGGHREKTREDDDELVVVRKREVSAVIAEEVGRREMMLSGQGKSEAAKRRGRKEARTGELFYIWVGRKLIERSCGKDHLRFRITVRTRRRGRIGRLHFPNVGNCYRVEYGLI